MAGVLSRLNSAACFSLISGIKVVSGAHRYGQDKNTTALDPKEPLLI